MPKRKDVSEQMRSKYYTSIVDVAACADFKDSDVIQGLLVLMNIQHLHIARLEQRVAMLERGNRHATAKK